MTGVDQALAYSAPSIDPPHPLAEFRRDDTTDRVLLEVEPNLTGASVPATIFGGFLEHLSFAIVGGVSAELLANPTLCDDPNLTGDQRTELLANGALLEGFHQSGGDPLPFRDRWVSTPLPTGFGVAVLDAPSGAGVPFGWASVTPDAVKATVARIGSGVRLRAAVGEAAEIHQALFIPGRVNHLVARLWVRIGPGTRAANGTSPVGSLVVGFRRRRDGAVLAEVAQRLIDAQDRPPAWQRLTLDLGLPPGLVAAGEPIDYFVRWEPGAIAAEDLLIDRASLRSRDAVDGLDREVIDRARALAFTRLRWPGGNFASVYRWRDGVGPADRRATVKNDAWGGLEYHLFGTDEYISLCRAIGAEPHITVNAGTASPEEAAAWVQYCNGPASSPMGALRARNGHRAPYDVRVWEVGNELYASWQAGSLGAEEHALQFAAFASAMRLASPIPIELIACGNSFDFAEHHPPFDHVVADGAWHEALLGTAADDTDHIALHSIPMNDQFGEEIRDDEAHLAVLGQVTTWERRFLPALLRRCDEAPRSTGRPPISLAMTEWGPLGAHPTRLMAENFGAAIYAATFLNMVIRGADRITIASANGFMHGGCVRKVAGRIFEDPQVTVQDRYRAFIGARPLGCVLTGPGYDIPHPADIGAVDRDVPYVDAIVCRGPGDRPLRTALANRHPTRTFEVEIRVPGFTWPVATTVVTLAGHEVAARATPAEPERFPLRIEHVAPRNDAMTVVLPPSSVAWVEP